MRKKKRTKKSSVKFLTELKKVLIIQLFHRTIKGSINWKGWKSMVDTDIRPAYVDVAEVCRDWGCSRSKGYAIIKQLSEQMKSENPRLLTMSGKINRIYYEEACMRR